MSWWLVYGKTIADRIVRDGYMVRGMVMIRIRLWMFIIEFWGIWVVIMRYLFEIKVHSILSRLPSLFLLLQLDVFSFSKHSVDPLSKGFTLRLLLIGIVDQQRIFFFLLLFSLSFNIILC